MPRSHRTSICRCARILDGGYRSRGHAAQVCVTGRLRKRDTGATAQSCKWAGKRRAIGIARYGENLGAPGGSRNRQVAMRVAWWSINFCANLGRKGTAD